MGHMFPYSAAQSTEQWVMSDQLPCVESWSSSMSLNAVQQKCLKLSHRWVPLTRAKLSQPTQLLCIKHLMWQWYEMAWLVEKRECFTDILIYMYVCSTDSWDLDGDVSLYRATIYILLIHIVIWIRWLYTDQYLYIIHFKLKACWVILFRLPNVKTCVHLFDWMPNT